jgi:hypothetical protein
MNPDQLIASDALFGYQAAVPQTAIHICVNAGKGKRDLPVEKVRRYAITPSEIAGEEKRDWPCQKSLRQALQIYKVNRNIRFCKVSMTSDNML